jgi:hypothetical protein
LRATGIPTPRPAARGRRPGIALAAAAGVPIVKQPLVLPSGGSAFDCSSERGRFLIGIGEGKVVARGTDVGLSDAARDLLNALARRSVDLGFKGALRFIHVADAGSADDSAEQALQLTAPGDLLFFLVPDRAAAAALKRALDVLSRR